MFKHYILCLFLFSAVCLQSEVIDIHEIDEVRSYVIEDALCLFDIDDTLIVNPFSLGTSPWRCWARAKFPNYNTNFVLFDALTLAIAKNAPYKTVEPTTAQLISDLQSDGVTVFAFTARGRTQWYTTDIEGVDQFTHKQLKHAGIDFSKTPIPVPLQALEATYFYDGIIFAQHIKKGDLLKHLFKDLKYTPSLILFVDDRLDQVLSVEAALKEVGIPFIGFWYRRSEKDHANFDPQIANVQLEHLLLSGEILNDIEAKKITETKQAKEPYDYLKEILDKVDLEEIAPKV